jgi:hypothetical protein
MFSKNNNKVQTYRKLQVKQNILPSTSTCTLLFQPIHNVVSKLGQSFHIAIIFFTKDKGQKKKINKHTVESYVKISRAILHKQLDTYFTR